MLLLIEGLRSHHDYSRLLHETDTHLADFSKVVVFIREQVTPEDSPYDKLVEEVAALLWAHHYFVVAAVWLG